MTLQRKIDAQSLTGPGKPRHLNPDAPSEFLVPRYGPHDLDPPNNPDVWPILNNTDSCAAGKDDAGED
jgi:NADH-quinone oxidoreductase subunit B